MKAAPNAETFSTPDMLKKQEQGILQAWIKNQLANITLRLDLISKEDLEKQSREFMRAFIQAISTGNIVDIEAPEYAPVVAMLTGISRDRAVQGFTPSETTTYIFSLKDAILQFSQKEFANQPELLNRETVLISRLLDKLGLLTFETYAEGREEVIIQQMSVMAKMATPVLTLWNEILLLPIVGQIDSKRTQDIMESMLAKIQTEEARVIILDILGVPSVDSAVANHVIKITRATKLMGCDCIITGISSSIAQSLVHLDIDLGGVLTKTTLKDGLAHAYKWLNLKVIDD